MKALALILPFFLTACGGITHYVHKDAWTPGAALKAVHLKPGEEKLILKHRQGIAMAGGYKEGLTVEDPSIAEVRYGQASSRDAFAPKAYLMGKKTGTTRAAYGNRMGPSAFKQGPNPRVFQVVVE